MLGDVRKSNFTINAIKREWIIERNWNKWNGTKVCSSVACLSVSSFLDDDSRLILTVNQSNRREDLGFMNAHKQEKLGITNDSQQHVKNKKNGLDRTTNTVAF